MKFNIRWLQTIYFVLSLYVLLTAFNSQYLILSLVSYVFFVSVGVNIGLHRSLAHQGLPLDSLAAKFSLSVAALVNLGSPLEWALVHRLHHNHADTELDPHSPKQVGRWQVFLNTWKLPLGISSKEKLSAIRDLVKSKYVMFLHRKYVKIAVGAGLLSLAVMGLEMAVYLYFLPVSLCLLGTSLVNTFCHDQQGAQDNVWISIMTCGEGYHKSHHIAPRRTDYSSFGKPDLTGKLFQLMRAVS